MQIVAGVHLIAFAGEFIACGAEHKADIAVCFAYFPRHIHAGELFHENIQHDQLKSAGLADTQKLLPARKVCKLGGCTQQLAEISPQTLIYLFIIVNDCDPQNQTSS